MFSQISPLRLLVLVIAAAAAVLGVLTVNEAFSSGSTPDSILQGDIDCSGTVDETDSLKSLMYVADLDFEQTEPCPDAGTLAAIPGPPGPEGPAGSIGLPGPQGPPGISGYEIVTINGASNSDFSKAETAPCPEGKRPIGGGAAVSGGGVSVALRGSSPTQSGNAWVGSAQEVNATAASWSILVYAICAVIEE